MAIIPQNVYYGIKTKYLNKFKIDYQGTVATVSDLPTVNIAEGTVYNVESNGSNYLWNGSEWDELGNSGKNSIYCSDCNNALVPGRYYIDASTAHSPSGKPGILFVSGKGGAGDPVYQHVVSDLPDENVDYLDVIYCRRIVLSSGAYSSASPWNIQNYLAIPSGWLGLFKESDKNSICMSPPAGRQLTGQTASYYEVLRFYQIRDANRDPSLESYGGIARFVDKISPTSGNEAHSQIALFFCEGGICSDKFMFGAKLRNASVVTYSDETTDTFYGKLYREGDVIEGKTVASVNYTKEYSSVYFSFTADNVAALGSASSRFTELFAGSGSINTSDERLKESIETIPDKVLDAWGEVGWVQYQFKDAVEKKGENARLHTGAVAQRIDAVFKSHGLDASQYGLFCYDSWEDEWDEGENGEKYQTQTAGDKYSLRYEEALCMEAAYQRRRADRLEARIKALEEKLK